MALNQQRAYLSKMDESNTIYRIHAACREGHVSDVESLLSANPKLAQQKDDDSRLPLHWCLTAPSPSALAILELLSALPRFDPDAEDGSGWTPLMIAASLPSSNADAVEMIRLLRQKGADIEAKNKAGQTALFFACSKSNLDVVRQLIASGASVRFSDSRKQTPLHRAAAVGAVPILQLLMEKRAALNGQDRDGFTALHHAISEGHGDAAMCLLEAGADSDKVDSEGHVAMELCPDKMIRDSVVTECRRGEIDLCLKKKKDEG